MNIRDNEESGEIRSIEGAPNIDGPLAGAVYAPMQSEEAEIVFATFERESKHKWLRYLDVLPNPACLHPHRSRKRNLRSCFSCQKPEYL